jgi:hypothetical protein
MTSPAGKTLQTLRAEYHRKLARKLLSWTKKDRSSFPNFADGSSKNSVLIAKKLCQVLGWREQFRKISPQQVGKLFENCTRQFIRQGFAALAHLRPGTWLYPTKDTDKEISRFVQYRHLEQLASVLREKPDLRSMLGEDYLITPDIVIARQPVADAEINQHFVFLPGGGKDLANLTPFRAVNQSYPILHACVSCKWTIRSDRGQSARSEALNLIRNRKGHLPHIIVVTAEPLPTRIACLALGTGELDCVYHIALPELQEVIAALSLQDQAEQLNVLRNGERLRDISDLPFDLAS